MADGSPRKPAKRDRSFSGISRKDSVKALRFSRSLNLKRPTSEISKRQVGTEISDPFTFPLELTAVETFWKNFLITLNLLLKFQNRIDIFGAIGWFVDVCYLFMCKYIHLAHEFKLPTCYKATSLCDQKILIPNLNSSPNTLLREDPPVM